MVKLTRKQSKEIKRCRVPYDNLADVAEKLENPNLTPDEKIELDDEYYEVFAELYDKKCLPDEVQKDIDNN